MVTTLVRKISADSRETRVRVAASPSVSHSDSRGRNDCSGHRVSWPPWGPTLSLYCKRICAWGVVKGGNLNFDCMNLAGCWGSWVSLDKLRSRKYTYNMGVKIPELTEQQLRNFCLKVAKSSDGGCWEWVGAKWNRQYGTFRLQAKTYIAHRVAYFLATGKQPGQLCVCHICDNPGCVNPSHLFLGTVADNMADRDHKGRQNHPSGEQHCRAKLTEKQVLRIRASDKTLQAIADKYGVTRQTISHIKTRKTWKHI